MTAGSVGARWGESPGGLKTQLPDEASKGAVLRGNIPFQRKLNFAGRDTVLQTINHKLVADDRDVRRVAVWGLGGVGKTQIAIEFAYRNAGAYDLIWWLRAEDRSRLTDDFLSLGEYLQLEETASLSRSALITAIRDRLEKDGRWLLIFDNAEKPDALTPYLPRACRGDVLITSRNHLWGDLATPVPVKIWERAESVEFLDMTLSGPCGMEGDNLADDLGDLPLALAQAAAYINQTGIVIPEYRKLFGERREELWGKERQPFGYADTVRTTWSLALSHIRKSHPTSLALLVLFAQLGSGSLTNYRSLAHTFRPPVDDVIADPLKLNEAIAPLRLYSLVDVNGDVIVIHPLVRSVVLDYQRSEALAAREDRSVVSVPATSAQVSTASSSGSNAQILTQPAESDSATSAQVSTASSSGSNAQILTQSAAQDLLRAAPKPVVNEIRELFGALYLSNPRYMSDYEAVLQFVKRRFSSFILVDEDKLFEAIEAANATESDWARVNTLVRPLLAVLPRSSECFTRLTSLPEEIVAASVVVDFQTRGDYPDSPESMYLSVIDYCGIGKPAWVVLEQAIREARSITDLEDVVRIGRRDLGDEFEKRYLKLRRKPYDDELAKYVIQQNEERKAHEKRESIEREERQSRLAAELKKYEINRDVTRTPSRRELELMRQRLETYLVEVDRISDLKPYQGNDPLLELKTVSEQAKTIFGKYYPQVCRDIVLLVHNLTSDRAPPDVAVSTAPKLRRILESVRDLMEMDLAAVASKVEGSGGQLLPVVRALLACTVFTLTLGGLLFGTMIWILTK